MRIEKIMSKRIKDNIPVLFTRKEECCGCSACYATCPVNAIRMEMDEEGFLYPYICADKCVGCKKCMVVCPIKTAKQRENRICG